MLALLSGGRSEVALLAEGVDRNFSASAGAWALWVALLAEGVDRNTNSSKALRGIEVALLAEGVDRNINIPPVACGGIASPSSRRAWIEMLFDISGSAAVAVALLAEGVDRNTASRSTAPCASPSPSSRRAWIEIFLAPCRGPMHSSRPPRGGRG